MINELRELSKSQDSLIFDISTTIDFLEGINYHSERNKIISSIPDHVNKKIDTLELFFFLLGEKSYSIKKWKELEEIMKITKKDYNDYNSFLDTWLFNLGNMIFITTEDFYNYKRWLCASSTLQILSWWGLKEWEIDEIIKFINSRLTKFK